MKALAALGLVGAVAVGALVGYALAVPPPGGPPEYRILLVSADYGRCGRETVESVLQGALDEGARAGWRLEGWQLVDPSCAVIRLVLSRPR